MGNSARRRPLRSSVARAAADLRRRCHPDAGARHRHQHRDLQRDQGGAAQPAAVSAIRRSWSCSSEQNPDGNTDLVAPLTFVDWRAQAQCDRRRWPRSVSCATRSRAAREPLERAERARDAGSVHGPRRNADRSGARSSPEEGVAGADRVVVLSRAFWERHFGGAPGVIGRNDSARRACRTPSSA